MKNLLLVAGVVVVGFAVWHRHKSFGGAPSATVSTTAGPLPVTGGGNVLALPAPSAGCDDCSTGIGVMGSPYSKATILPVSPSAVGETGFHTYN